MNAVEIPARARRALVQANCRRLKAFKQDANRNWRGLLVARGFTLMELIGVMAVLAILAAALVPVLVKRVDVAAETQETRLLRAFAEGLTGHVSRNKNVPDQTTWAQAIASELGVHPNTVSTNDRGNRRVYLIDPTLRVGATNGVLPYSQTVTGSVVQPQSPRLMLISSLGQPLPANIVSGVASSTNAFSNIWNTAEGTLPSDWNWPGRKEDLKIQRISLAPLFKLIVLNNSDSETLPQGRYSVDSAGTNSVPPGGIMAYFIDGTVINLLGATNNTPEASQIVSRSTTFVYERASWRGQVFEGLKTLTSDVDLAADLFLASMLNANSKPFGNPTTQSHIIDAMYQYMAAYVAWSLDNPPFPSQPNSPTKSALNSAQSTLATLTANIMFKPEPSP